MYPILKSDVGVAWPIQVSTHTISWEKKGFQLLSSHSKAYLKQSNRFECNPGDKIFLWLTWAQYFLIILLMNSLGNTNSAH